MSRFPLIGSRIIALRVRRRTGSGFVLATAHPGLRLEPSAAVKAGLPSVDSGDVQTRA
jgi:hypothetical protein